VKGSRADFKVQRLDPNTALFGPVSLEFLNEFLKCHGLFAASLAHTVACHRCKRQIQTSQQPVGPDRSQRWKAPSSQIFRSFEANSSAIERKEREIWPNLAFPG
jgi:hypothetical protein